MKTNRFLFVLGFLLWASVSFGEDAQDPITFTTTSGRELTDAVLTKVEVNWATFTFSGGIVRLPLEEVPKEVRDQLGIQRSALLDAEVESLEQLKGILETELESDGEPVTAFQAQYTAYLQDLREKSQTEGFLEGVLMIDEELASLAEAKDRDYSAFPALARLRSIYEAKLPELSAQVVAQRNRSMGLYLLRLEDLKVKLTQEDKIDEALAIATEAERIQEQMKQELVGEEKEPAPAPKGMLSEAELKEKGFPPGTKFFEGHYYHLSLGPPIPWRDARDKCKEMGGYLVCIGSKEEDEFVLKMCADNANDYRVWIGATRSEQGVDEWVNGEDFVYENFSKTSRLPYSYCFYAVLTNYRYWGAFSPNPTLVVKGYVCEWEAPPK